MSANTSVDHFLAHYGVKGMKWGKHKAKPAYTEKKGEYRKRVRQERRQFDQDHLTSVINKAMKKGDAVLIKSTLPGSYGPTVMSGKEFVNYASKGGLLDARMTDIYATKSGKSGPYILNDKARPQYQKSERR